MLKGNKWLFWLPICFLTGVLLVQQSFAENKDINVIYEDGDIVVGRKNKLDIVFNRENIIVGRMSKAKKVEGGSFVSSDISYAQDNPKVKVFAAYTSSNTIYAPDTYNAVLDPEEVCLFVAFAVSGETTVEVEWKVKGEESFKDTELIYDDGELLSPEFWYYAWYKFDSFLIEGEYQLKVSVQSTTGGHKDKDTCKFEVFEMED